MWESPVSEFEGLDLSDLGTDQAFVRVSWSSPPAWLYHLETDCEDCPWQLLGPVSSSPFILSTHHTNRLLLRRNNSTRLITTADAEEDPARICDVSGDLGEFGVYDLKLWTWPGQPDACSLEEALAPVYANLALLVAFLVVIGAAVTWWALNRWAGRYLTKAAKLLGWAKEESSAKQEGKSRVRSLDTFRGVAIMIMIFVNDGGGGYWFMEHATWNGLYVADLVFPWFIWIMGVCIPMSVRSVIRRETPVRTVVWQVAVRSVKLWLLGFILNTLGGWINVSRLRVPGVLQRFGICYFIVFMVGYSFTRSKPTTTDGPLRHVQDLVQLLPQWVVMAALLTVHQLVLYLVPAPGCDPGYMGPGGLHDWAPTHNNSGCIGGITGYIDRVFFTVDHIYGNPTAKGVYSAGAFDPEGIFGTLPSIFQVWLGYQAGFIMQVHSSHSGRMVRWIVWAVVTGIIATVLTFASQNDGPVPLNKNLWSVSFVLVTSCFAFILLVLLYFVIDVKKKWKGQPFFYAGMNSILLYCGHSVGYNLFPFHFIIGDMRTHSAKLPEAMWCCMLWMIIAFVLYRKRVFVTV